MKRYIIILAVVILGFSIKSFSQDIVWKNISRENLNLKTVLVDAHDPHIIYIGSDKGVFKSEDGADSWRNILSVRGKNPSVNFLLIDPQNKNYLYAATGNGLFYSNNQGKSWKKIFQGKNYLEDECTTIAVFSTTIYLGTKAGLFTSKDKGQRWHKQAGTLGNSNILAIAYNLREANYIYVACLEGVFKTKDGGESWERIFVAKPVENNANKEAEEGKEDQDEEERFSQIRYVSCVPNNLNHLYLATSRGLYKSRDRAKTWEAVSSYGLLSQDIKFLLCPHESDLYAVTKSGVFEYRDERWWELSFALMAEEMRFLALDNQNNLYAACDKGLFKADLRYFSNDKQDNTISLYFENEPKINEVQQAAIKYAEVEPEKIMRWRRQAAKRALLPQLSVSMDRDNNRTVSSSIWGTYGNSTGTGKYYVGPDDETRYHNKNWGVSLTWDFGDLIWSDDQTNIDVRSRLMVELRDDILDEVTKLYFERIRTKMEMDNLGIEERKKRFEKELKLQELTASLDALTGGYFSEQVKNKT